jgi:hypothetical protein
MSKIVIWMPRDKKEVGHVAISTNAYYVSFWPARCLEKDGKHIGSIADAAVFVLDVHKGRLVFNQDFEKIDEDDPNKDYEEESDPKYEHEIDAAKVSNEDLNAVIEEFLRYNGIDPEDVTLAKGKEKYREFKQLAASLPQEEAKLIKDDQKPVKSLSKTKYSIVTELVSCSKKDNLVPFYNSQQSCVSLAFNLVQMAWLKSHPDQPIPIVNYEEAKNVKEVTMLYYSYWGASSLLTGKIPKEFAYKVSWFEKEVVQKYLITVKVNNQPIIPAQLEIEKGLRQVKPTLVIYFVLLLLGYFFPDTAYPNVLIYWNYVASEDQVIADDPSILRYFIVPVFVILLAHNFSCGVVLSVVIFQLGDISYAIMESYSGEFWGSHLLVESLSTVIRVFDDVREHCKRIGRKPENLGLSGLVRMLIDSRRAHH